MNISTAKTRNELAEIRSLRYLVNKQELGKDFLFQKEEETDSQSILLYAKRKDSIIGSLKCLFKYENKEIRDYWGIKKPEFKSKVAVVSRLVIHPAYRKTRVAYDLTTNIYKHALLEGCHIALIETEEQLVKMYEKVGFKLYRTVSYPYGQRFQMFINPWDTEHLKQINSPFLHQYTSYIQMVNDFARV